MKLIRPAWVLALIGMFALAVVRAETAPATGAGNGDSTEAEREIAGVEIPRANGGFLGLEIVNNRFLLSFYDQAKKKVTPDVASATMRWPVKYQPTDERTVLNPGGDGTSLTSLKVVRPPHNFHVSISLFVEGNDTAVENYRVDVRG